MAAIKQHDIETSNQLESAKDRIRKLSEIVERSSPSNVEEEVSLKTEIIKQKEEMIQCLQDELIKVRLAEAENDENLRDLNKKVSELEEVKFISIFNFQWFISIKYYHYNAILTSYELPLVHSQ